MKGQDPWVGQVLGGRLRLTRLLGAGGMGSVYEAEHVTIGARAAVKLLHPEYASRADAIKRFQREAQSAASIGHENIVKVTDDGQAPNGAPYLVMELLPGESLADRLDAEPKPGLAFTAYVACQVLSGLAAAHDARIVHRDLKPENILDFGLSKVISAGIFGTEPTRITKTGVVFGTPEYMSPEHARGARDVDHRTDLYAMGVVR